MPATHHVLRRNAGALLLAFVAGCGGGDDGDSATATPTTTPTTTAATTTTASTGVDLYVGRWMACIRENNGSTRETVELTRASDTHLNFTFTGQQFAAADCTGTMQGTDTGTGTVTLVGKGSVGGEVVDKADVVENGQADKDIFAVRADGKLYVGRHADDGGPVDAQGYPTTFDSDPFTRV